MPIMIRPCVTSLLTQALVYAIKSIVVVIESNNVKNNQETQIASFLLLDEFLRKNSILKF